MSIQASPLHPIVVTGAAGFIGSYLVKHLLRQGCSKADLCLVDEESLFETRSCTQSFRSQKLRRLSPEAFTQAFTEGTLLPSVIFHLGASSSTEEFREDYLRVVNLESSQSLWNASVQHRVPFFYASSAATYGDGSQGFSDDPALIPALQPLNPYGWSKQRFDLFVLEELERSSPTPPQWAGFKFFNVYGPGEEHKGSQASIVLHAKKQIESTGSMKLFRSHRPDVRDGEQKRDFVWVGDIAQTLLSFASKDLKNGIYNLGTGEARSFMDLTQAIARALGRSVKIDFIDTPERLRPGYQYYTQAELQNLRAAGHASPMTSIEDGVQQTLKEWT